MGSKLLSQPFRVDNRRGYYDYDDDFSTYTDAKLWTAAVTNSSLPLVSTTLQDGVLVLVNTAATNDACFVNSTNKQFLWANNITHMAEIILQFAEASTNNANIWFGFSTLNTVAQLVNANGDVATNFTGAGIYKKGGQLFWQTCSSQTTTQNKSTTTYTAGQAGYQRLRIQVQINNSVAEVTYWIDQGGSTAGGQQMRNNAAFPANGAPIKDFITLASPGAMYFGFGVKNGTTSAETLNVDYAAAWKLRSNFLGST